MSCMDKTVGFEGSKYNSLTVGVYRTSELDSIISRIGPNNRSLVHL